jgi:hypothetical protein
MSFKLPFTEKTFLKEVSGKQFRLGCKDVGGSRVSRLQDFSFDTDKWEIQDGVVNLLDDKDSVIHCIDSIEIKNGTVFLSGEAMKEHGRHNSVRTVLYEKKELGSDFLVAIASHVDYEEKTLPRLIRSLDREGIPEDRVLVFIGGSQAEEPKTQEKGYIRIPVEGNYLGCTALSYLISDTEIEFDYVVVMHDTCEVTSGFAEKIASIDIGLPYDLIEGRFELGLWSKSFLEMLRGLDGFKLEGVGGYDIFGFIKGLSRLYRKCAEAKTLRSKDVYGTGINRAVLEFEDLGVKKYSGAKKTGGRP